MAAIPVCKTYCHHSSPFVDMHIGEEKEGSLHCISLWRLRGGDSKQTHKPRQFPSAQNSSVLHHFKVCISWLMSEDP